MAQVFIGSTSIDLPEHRARIIDACIRLGLQPVIMEHMTSGGPDAIARSFEKVDEADVYVGIFARRYGFVPSGYSMSITEMEYRRAKSRGIPLHIFLSGEQHPFVDHQLEKDATGIGKLQALRDELRREHVVSHFDSPDDLAYRAILDLLPHQVKEHKQIRSAASLPPPPQPFIAHPYTLLQDYGLIGREDEFTNLSQWATDGEDGTVPIFIVKSIGGMGKSALCWHWVNNLPNDVQFRAVVWWSFYEPDSHFDNFTIQSLAYLTGRPVDEVTKMPRYDRERELLLELERTRTLIVLDGFERQLLAYSRGDDARISEVEESEGDASNDVDDPVMRLPRNKQPGMRKTTDPRLGGFLKRLLQLKSSRILISSRLIPADLETQAGKLDNRCRAFELLGLSDEAALDLWDAALPVANPAAEPDKQRHVARNDAATEELLQVFGSIGNHALLIQLLAGEVWRFHQAPGDFLAWKASAQSFDPFTIPLVQRTHHVLEHSLRGLPAESLAVLETLACFRTPAPFNALTEIFRRDHPDEHSSSDLDRALTDLEERGLMGWDRQENRYDLHPVVRGCVLATLTADRKRHIHQGLFEYFSRLPWLPDSKVKSIADLSTEIETFFALIGIGSFSRALRVLQARIYRPSVFRFGSHRPLIRLFNCFFPDNIESDPKGLHPRDQSWFLHSLGHVYMLDGLPARAVEFFDRARAVYDDVLPESLVNGFNAYSDASRLCGSIWTSESFARQALKLARQQKKYEFEAKSLERLGHALGMRGEFIEGKAALRRGINLCRQFKAKQSEGVLTLRLAQITRLADRPQEAISLAKIALSLSAIPQDFIRSHRVIAAAALDVNDIDVATSHIGEAIQRARRAHALSEEIPAVITQADVFRRLGRFDESLAALDEIWEIATRGPFPAYLADAYLVKANALLSLARESEACDAAIEAYRNAWCDGPPFSYASGLQRSTDFLTKHCGDVPEMEAWSPPATAMPDVPIDPEKTAKEIAKAKKDRSRDKRKQAQKSEKRNRR